ncbi:MAG: hypothetical protein AAB340_02855 [Patescibacteria group bacterium]
MAEKISQNDLAALLMQNLKGTALQPIVENNTYVTGPDGFVAPETIDKLMGIFQQATGIFKLPNPYRKPVVAQHIAKIKKAIESIRRFGTKADQ